MREKTAFELHVRAALLPGGAARKATLFAPGAEPKALAARADADGVAVTVAAPDPRGVLRIE